MQSFTVDKVTFGNGNLSIIAGPCVVETSQHALFMAQEISDICKHVGVDFVYTRAASASGRLFRRHRRAGP